MGEKPPQVLDMGLVGVSVSGPEVMMLVGEGASSVGTAVGRDEVGTGLLSEDTREKPRRDARVRVGVEEVMVGHHS